MSDGDSLFTKKSSRSEAKDADGATPSSADAKLGAKMSLNEMDESPDAADSGAKGGGASPPPPRASVGWGSEAAELASEQKDKDSVAGESKRAGRRRKGSDAGVGGAGAAAGGKFGKNRYFDDDGESTDIVEIPDLEEEEREPDITAQVAEAPRNTTRAVQSLKELEKDIKFALPTTGTHGVDLQLLTSALCPEKAVGEPDEPWNFDSLLNDISQELQKDVDEKEEFLRTEAAAAAT